VPHLLLGDACIGKDDLLGTRQRRQVAGVLAALRAPARLRRLLRRLLRRDLGRARARLRAAGLGRAAFAAGLCHVGDPGAGGIAVAVGKVADVLVPAHRLERGLAQERLAADAAEVHFDDETRREPGRAAQVGVGGADGGGGLATAAAQPGAPAARRCVVGAAAAAAGAAPAVVGVGLGPQKRAEARAAALGGGVADDRELVAGRLLGIAPVVAAAAVVRTIATLGNDAFEV